MGSFTGVRPADGSVSKVKDTMWDNPTKRYGVVENVNTVIDRDELHQIRARIQHVHIQDNVPEYAKRLTNRDGS